ncbi:MULTISPECIES: carbohydrate kinase family protein [Prauserella salsuginis group]|uniref:Carbohydrate kinase family protein n=1 Tax=Prauserella salsuginis TaxID=387889 RepID=A0ABW6G2Y4_9PSEU|nr:MULTISPECIES: carbohydrate kinase family protein [Prauserella salsuginis group]MCR3718433.1 Sugar or nucleoside kinase, ribokinase family [Prauserella flava]MCR3733003.1 Sugar or nucleoside kinase, ribokinase family [Prauserella salsuginis]
MRIVVVGDAGLDVVARHEGPLVHGGDTRAQVGLTGGGAGANTALWLRAAGADPVLLARVGEDPGGRLLRTELEAAGVTCAFAVDADAATCCVVVLVDPDGQRTMLPDRGANKHFSPADVDTVGPRALAGADHLHLSGYVLLDPSSRPAGLAALEAARAAGVPTSVDPQAAALITDPDRFLADVRGVDLLLPNAAELAALTGSGDPAAAGELLGHVGAVAVTTGLDGAAWVDADGMRTVPAQPAPCVDSTGAGDAFNAGLLTARLRGEPVRDCLTAGVQLGAQVVSQVGAQPAPGSLPV